jgi:hypothetical protein
MPAAPWTLCHVELHARALGERLVAFSALDVAEMREQILASSARRNEAVAFAFVEPLHGSGLVRRHVDPSLRVSGQHCAARCERQETIGGRIDCGSPRKVGGSEGRET